MLYDLELEVRATLPAFLRLPVLLYAGVGIILKITMLLLELTAVVSVFFGTGLLKSPVLDENP